MVSRETLERKRAEYMASLHQLEGAIMAIDELLKEDALTIDELKRLTGAAEVGEPEPLKGGEA